MTHDDYLNFRAAWRIVTGQRLSEWDEDDPGTMRLRQLLFEGAEPTSDRERRAVAYYHKRRGV